MKNVIIIFGVCVRMYRNIVFVLIVLSIFADILDKRNKENKKKKEIEIITGDFCNNCQLTNDK